MGLAPAHLAPVIDNGRNYGPHHRKFWPTLDAQMWLEQLLRANSEFAHAS